MRRQRTLTVFLLVIVLGLLAFIGSTVIGSVQNNSAHEYRIVIPEGTGELIEQGEDPGIIPQKIELVLGEKDVLVIENQDTIGHRISDFWIGAGETLRQKFKQEAIYQGECTVHESAQIEIIVTKG
jgi:hypothetical protein